MLKPQDLNLMQSFGRYVARDDDLQALISAAEYIVIAGPFTSEAQHLRTWFHEGVRNYATDMPHTDACMRDLEVWVAKMAI